MHLPGAPSLLFLAYLFVLLPYAAIRGARVLRAAREGTTGPLEISRETIWTRTIFNLGILFAIALFTGMGFGYRIFAVPRLGLREVGIAAAVLAAHFGLRALVRGLRSPEERQRMIVYHIAPRTPRERALAVVAILCAGVAEEAAYRGVAMAILWYALGSPWIAAFLCSCAFALAHWVQGWKSVAMIFAIALLMHGLVALTGTLVLAMVVHVAYDLVAGHLIREEALRLEAAASAASPTASLTP